jgi:hypothetical protein
MLTIYGKVEVENIPAHILRQIAEEMKNSAASRGVSASQPRRACAASGGVFFIPKRIKNV